MNKNTFYIDSYLLDRSELVAMHWNAFMYDNR